MVNSTIRSVVLQILGDRLSKGTPRASTERCLLYALGYQAFSFLAKHQLKVETRYTWVDLVKLGLHPGLIRREHGLLPANPFNSAHKSINHPLHIASMFWGHSAKGEARLAIEEHNLMIREFREAAEKYEKTSHGGKLTSYPTPSFGYGYFPGYMQDHRFSKTWINPYVPDVEPLYDYRFARVAHIGLYGNEGREDLFEAADDHAKVEQLWRCRLFLKADDLEETIRTRARKSANKIVTGRGRIRYPDLVRMVQLMRPKTARLFINRMKGVTVVLGICRPDATEKEMSRGLAALTKASGRTWDDMLLRFGRPPTGKEIASVRSPGIVDVLHDMPWSVLEPTVSQPNEVKKIRAALLAHVDRAPIGKLQGCLLEGTGRGDAVPGFELEARPQLVDPEDKTTDQDWGIIYEWLWNEYQEAQAYRTHLQYLSGDDPYLAVLATLAADKEAATPHMDALGKAHYSEWNDLVGWARRYAR